MDMSPRRSLILGLTALLLAAAPAVGGPGGASAPVIDHEPQDCDEYAPESLADPALAPGGEVVNLAAMVLLDGVDKATAGAIMATAAESYVPLDITLTAAYKRVSFSVAGKTTPGGSADAQDLIEAAKAMLGGIRPATADVVYILTTRDLSLDGDSGVVGYADCIGGVRYPDRAFAIGEASVEIVNLGLQFYVDGPARIAAHEIGHLLGAHHHYANCVQGAGIQNISSRDAGLCTVMINALDIQGPRFGTLEAMVVRGHAEDFAAP